MRKTADVRSLEALTDAKTALVEFREVVGLALSEGYSDSQRTLWWLQNDQATFWRHEHRRRTGQINQAKSELFRAKLSAGKENNSCLEQRKMLERAQRRLEEAEVKIKNVQKWVRLVDRQMMLFKGACQPVARAVEADLPRGEGRLEQMLDRLEKYVRTSAPRTRTEQRSDASSAGRSASPEKEST